MPGWVGKAPEMPGLVHEFLRQATSGQLTTRLESSDLDEIRRINAESERQQTRRFAGVALMVSGALLIGFKTGPWLLGDWSVTGLVVGLTGVLLLLRRKP